VSDYIYANERFDPMPSKAKEKKKREKDRERGTVIESNNMCHHTQSFFDYTFKDKHILF
jgi:hypothetical protein